MLLLCLSNHLLELRQVLLRLLLSLGDLQGSLQPADVAVQPVEVLGHGGDLQDVVDRQLRVGPVLFATQRVLKDA